MKQLSKDEWLKEIPELIYKLKKDYNFYYSCFPVRISKDILEIVKNPKNRHKIVLYKSGNKYFLVVYRKADCVIYYTNAYWQDIDDGKYNRIRYFIKKFSKAYEKAKEELESELYNRLYED